MTVIDLGDRWSAPEVDGPAPPARRPRRWLSGVVGVLCLVSLAGGAPLPAAPPGVTVPAAPDARVVAVGDLLLVGGGNLADAAPGTARDGGLVAHQLATGRPLWRLPVPDSVEAFGAMAVRDLVVLTVTGRRQTTQVVGVAAADGTERWRIDGDLAVASPAGHLLVWSYPDDPSEQPSLRSVDAASGATRWSVRMPQAELGLRERGDRTDLLVVLVGRRLELRDPGSGGLVRAVDLPATGSPGLSRVSDDLVVVTDVARQVVAYDIETLRPRWSLPPAPADRPYVSACGTMLCLDDGSSAVSLLDPATGRTGWRADGWTWLHPAGDRLLAGRGAWAGSAELTLLETATGRPLRGLGRWEPIQRFRADGTADGPATVLRRQRDGRFLIARFDRATDGLRVLAVLHGVVGQCGMHRSYVHCRRDGGAFGVWELPG